MRGRSASPLNSLLDLPRHASTERRKRQTRSRMRQWALGVGSALTLLLLLCSRPGAAGQPPAGQVASADDMSYFVQVSGTQFVVNCKAFYPAGWNQWEATEASAGALELFGASLPPNNTGPALVRGLLDRAVANRFSVVRAWVNTVTQQYALASSPGQYNEAVFRGVDYLLDQARQRGIRVLLSLTDNWQQTGGADEFVRWAGSGLPHEAFFSDPRIKALSKSHVQAVVGRVNSINGRRYSDDPTIFAWDLINEPRCYKCGAALSSWIQEMAAFVKSLDSNHLLTVGEEGFYPAGVPQAAANPQGASAWAVDEGQSFVADHASPYLDFMAIHLWVNNWNDKTPEFVQRWMQAHISDAQAAGRPLLLEEFGVWGGDQAERQRFYQQILSLVQQNAEAGGPMAGALFWTWYAPGQKAPAEEGGSAGGLFGVFESDGQTWPIISSFARAMADLSSSPAAGCSPAVGSHKAATTLPDCSDTEVGGRAGTGREGPSCSLDINECARGTAGCDPNAGCVNTPGGFTCACYQGYTGDGTTGCSPDPAALTAVQARYATDGPGKLACQEGQDVAYPEGAPGFQYDLTGALARSKTGSGGQQGAFGSRTAVEPISCMLACEQAPGCDSFAFNPTQKACFLKTGASRKTCSAVPTVCVSARGKTYSCGTWQTYFRTGGASGKAGSGAAQTSPSPAAAGGRGGGGGGSVPLLPSQPAQSPTPSSVQLFEALGGQSSSP